MSRGRRAARALGARAENLVVDHLRSIGFEVVQRNARVGALELDIIASRGGLLVFCEVRARCQSGAHPFATVGPIKRTRIRTAALRWLAEHCWQGSVRFDVAAVVESADGQLHLDYLADAF